MLIQNLRELENCGLVKRVVYPVVLPQVEYSLTALGETLIDPLAMLC
jgi:DNA-binding HxlR family transcriptional regulator